MMNDESKKPFWLVNPFRSSEEEELLEKVKLLEAELEEQKEKSKADRRKLLQVEADLVDARLHKDRMDAIHKENGRLRGMIRKQSEADLFFLSAQIMKELQSGKSKEDESVKPLVDRQLTIREKLGLPREPYWDTKSGLTSLAVACGIGGVIGGSL